MMLAPNSVIRGSLSVCLREKVNWFRAHTHKKIGEPLVTEYFSLKSQEIQVDSLR